MKHMLRKLITVLAVICVCMSAWVSPVCAAADPAVVTTNGIAGWPQAEDIRSTTGVLIEASTGTVLFNKSMDQQMYPASITKVLTTLVTLENGNMADQVTMTSTGVAYAVGGSANQRTQVGEVFTLEQLVYGTMLASANDMATQMGEYIGGSIENFCAMMNDRAAQLGCTGTHFANACGMPDPNHVTTAHDMALIMRAAVEREDFRKVIGTASYTIPATNMSGERTITNHDPLLLSQDFLYAGLLGGKTGYTDAARNTLVNAASRDGFTLICVSLQAADAPSAAFDNVELLNYGYDNFEMCEVLPAEYCSGGRNRIVVPKGVALADLTETVEEYKADDGTAMIRQSYSFGDYSLGQITLTKKDKALYEKALKEAAKAAEEAAKAAEEEARKNEKDEKSDEESSINRADSSENEEPQGMSDAEKSAKQKIDNIKKMFSAVGITVGVLLLIFVILLIRYFVKKMK